MTRSKEGQGNVKTRLRQVKVEATQGQPQMILAFISGMNIVQRVRPRGGGDGMVWY